MSKPTCTPSAFSSTFFTNRLTTGKLTSASRSARRISLSGSLMFSGVSLSLPGAHNAGTQTLLDLPRAACVCALVLELCVPAAPFVPAGLPKLCKVWVLGCCGYGIRPPDPAAPRREQEAVRCACYSVLLPCRLGPPVMSFCALSMLRLSLSNIAARMTSLPREEGHCRAPLWCQAACRFPSKEH